MTSIAYSPDERITLTELGRRLLAQAGDVDKNGDVDVVPRDAIDQLADELVEGVEGALNNAALDAKLEVEISSQVRRLGERQVEITTIARFT